MTVENRGKLKLYMGYAAGVGKTYKMLEDGQALKSQGVDTAAKQAEVKETSEQIAARDELVGKLDEEFRQALASVPNVPAAGFAKVTRSSVSTKATPSA